MNAAGRRDSVAGTRTSFRPREFVEVAPGLLFAVVAHGMESRRALAFLRYVRRDGALRKVETDEANELLRRRHPEYLFHSPRRDVLLHGVPVERIVAHYKPNDRMAELLTASGNDPFERKVVGMARVLGEDQREMPWLGVTGSVLVGAHQEHSDIDLVVYGHGAFERARERLRLALRQGGVQPLDDAMWHAAYQRRGCSLTFEQYAWHERRKLNKCTYDGTKVDLSCVADEPSWSRQRGRKLEQRVIQATVIDDRDAFTYPSRYLVDHPEIKQIVSYNPTYTGQAIVGETVEASGWVEQFDDGQLRLLVGTTREAPGEYIRVVGSGSARIAKLRPARERIPPA